MSLRFKDYIDKFPSRVHIPSCGQPLFLLKLTGMAGELFGPTVWTEDMPSAISLANLIGGRVSQGGDYHIELWEAANLDHGNVLGIWGVKDGKQYNG